MDSFERSYGHGGVAPVMDTLARFGMAAAISILPGTYAHPAAHPVAAASRPAGIPEVSRSNEGSVIPLPEQAVSCDGVTVSRHNGKLLLSPELHEGESVRKFSKFLIIANVGPPDASSLQTYAGFG